MTLKDAEHLYDVVRERAIEAAEEANDSEYYCEKWRIGDAIREADEESFRENLPFREAAKRRDEAAEKARYEVYDFSAASSYRYSCSSAG